MKKLKLFIIIACAVSFAINISAQFQIKKNGQIFIGEESVDVPNVEAYKLDTMTTLKLFGPNTGYRAGSRLSFGDQASKWVMNVMIGELSRDDTDKLWLHGKLGTYLTAGQGSEDTICYYDLNKGNYVNFNCDVRSTGVFVASDSRFKSNIAPIEESLASITALAPVSFNLNPRFGHDKNKRSADHYGNSPKDQRDKAFFDEYYNSINNDSLRYGFVAQEVKEIFPHLVRTDNEGYMYVDYIGLIPILVNSIKELKGELDILKNGQRNPQLRPQSDEYETNAVEDIIDEETVVASLQQNVPNPFNAETVIRFYLPENVASANMYIYDLQGTQIRNFEINDRGQAALTISASELNAGMYIYTLIADGKEVDTKRMILTK